MCTPSRFSRSSGVLAFTLLTVACGVSAPVVDLDSGSAGLKCKAHCDEPDAGVPAPDAGRVDDPGPGKDAGASPPDAGVAADAGLVFTHLVDAFLLPDIALCFSGTPCAATACKRLYRADGGAPIEFADDATFAVLRPSDPALQLKPLKECVRATMNADELKVRRAELARYRDDVQEWTDGGVRIELVIHELGPTEVELSPLWEGVWMASWNAAPLIRPLLTPKNDFVLVTHAIKDPVKGLYFNGSACGLTYGGDYGVSGGGYSWVPYTLNAWGFECSDHGVYTHEWLHQVEWALPQLSSYVDRYQNVFPACGLGDPDPFSWFPSTHACETDPDAQSCGGTCGGNDKVNEHVLRAHWPADRTLLANHCRDGKQNFGETGIDVGGKCL